MSKSPKHAHWARNRAAIVALVAGFPGLVAMNAAVAQTSDTARAMPFSQVQACVCMNQDIEDLRRETDLQLSLRKEQQAELDIVNRQIEQTRQTMIAGDPVATRELRRLIARQQKLRELLHSDVPLSSQDSVERLNMLVADYNHECTSRPMFQLDVERAKANAQCPPR